jgi:hypothetical protein
MPSVNGVVAVIWWTKAISSGEDQAGKNPGAGRRRREPSRRMEYAVASKAPSPRETQR